MFQQNIEKLPYNTYYTTYISNTAQNMNLRFLSYLSQMLRKCTLNSLDFKRKQKETMNKDIMKLRVRNLNPGKKKNCKH